MNLEDFMKGNHVTLRKRLKRENSTMVLQIFCLMRDIGNFKQVSGDSEIIHENSLKAGFEEFSTSYAQELDESYNDNHIVMFENELIQPPEMALYELTTDEWIRHNRINHSGWRIADVDNYMQGNPYFNQQLTQD